MQHRWPVLLLSKAFIARDIMFTNHFLNWFFGNGQVLNTERGAGIFQPAVDDAIKIVQNGGWVGAELD